MLKNCKIDAIEYQGGPSESLPYEVSQPTIQILDDMSARFTAVFNGPPDTKVIGRAWISDADGTMVDGKTGDVLAGSKQEIVLTIPRTKVQNGNLIACMRVEWPVYGTKHVVGWTLIRGDIVHPPKGKQCSAEPPLSPGRDKGKELR